MPTRNGCSPLICRRGDVTKQDVGSIRIFDNETVFEVAEALAERFLTNARASQGGDVLIEPMIGGAAAAPARAPRPRKPAYDPMKVERPPADDAGAPARPKVKGAFGRERGPDGAPFPKGPKDATKARPRKGKDNAAPAGKRKRAPRLGVSGAGRLGGPGPPQCRGCPLFLTDSERPRL